ncbi:MAG: FemAB family PEP-CTERM system-associated protein [Candidatus Omnitrophica bacterium]|nr:FemAB family PEP-CTERM system-associated protein [Candidatus Omnitrophota bacterium]
MDVRLFQDTPVDAEGWETYVRSCDHATSDHLWGWRRVLAGAFGFHPHYLGAVDGDRVVGILPLFRIPHGWGRCALSSIPFGNYGGICADSDDAARVLLEAAKERLDRMKGTYLELRHRTPLPDGALRPQRLHSRFVLPLAGDAALLFQALGSNNRNKVNRAMRLGLRVVASQDVNRLYPIHVRTAHRLGTPCFPRRYFELIVEEFAAAVEMSFVVHEHQDIAYSLLLRFKRSLVCQFNGSLAEGLKSKPNNLLVWHAIEQGCRLGFEEFDYCRSRRDSGTADFKRRLRLREEPLGYQYYLRNGQALPAHNPSNPTYRLAIRAWRRLPLALTRLLGPALVRYLA